MMQLKHWKTYKYLIITLALPVAGVLLSFQDLSEKKHKPEPVQREYKTQNVIILVIDGPRLTETFGDSTHQYIPYQANVLAPQGVLVPTFKNNGVTSTTPGHTAIMTGVYQHISNGGKQYPKKPSMFQYYLKATGQDSTKAWVIASKGKLNVLGNTKNRKWKNKYLPGNYCGVDGKGKDYTADQFTWRDAQKILKTYHPHLALINLLEVDVRGHQNEWPEYLMAIRHTDSLAMELWKFIQNDPVYKDKTTLIITNDHGRHLDGHKDGFVSHGDHCAGCRSIYLLGLGPDFKKNAVLYDNYDQLDISKTIAEMLHFPECTTKGQVMTDLFE